MMKKLKIGKPIAAFHNCLQNGSIIIEMVMALIRKMIEEWMETIGIREEKIYTQPKEKYQPSDLDRPRSWYP